MARHLFELEPSRRADQRAIQVGIDAAKQGAYRAKRWQKSFEGRVNPRTSSLHSVPEIEGEISVGKIEKDRPVGAEDPEHFLKDGGTLDVAIRPHSNVVLPTAQFLDTYVLQKARRNNDVEVRAGERQLLGVSHNQMVSMPAFPPLPATQLRDIVAPRRYPFFLKKVNRQPVTTPGVQNALASNGLTPDQWLDQWKIETGNSPFRPFLLEFQ